MNYTYLVQCRDGTFYCGWTNCLEKRVQAHNEGKGAKYTRARRPVALVYAESFATKEEAMRREAAIKRMSRQEKERLILSCEPVPLSHELIHQNIVTETAAHDKQVEDLVRSEISVPGIEDRQLERVDHTAHRINDTSGQQPSEGRGRQSADDLSERQDAYPAHGDVDA